MLCLPFHWWHSPSLRSSTHALWGSCVTLNMQIISLSWTSKITMGDYIGSNVVPLHQLSFRLPSDGIHAPSHPLVPAPPSSFPSFGVLSFWHNWQQISSSVDGSTLSCELPCQRQFCVLPQSSVLGFRISWRGAGILGDPNLSCASQKLLLWRKNVVVRWILLQWCNHHKLKTRFQEQSPWSVPNREDLCKSHQVLLL